MGGDHAGAKQERTSAAPHERHFPGPGLKGCPPYMLQIARPQSPH
jgi:hypothetical protein